MHHGGGHFGGGHMGGGHFGGMHHAGPAFHHHHVGGFHGGPGIHPHLGPGLVFHHYYHPFVGRPMWGGYMFHYRPWGWWAPSLIGAAAASLAIASLYTWPHTTTTAIINPAPMAAPAVPVANQPLPPPLTPMGFVYKLGYEDGVWHERYLRIGPASIRIFHHESNSDACASIPLLFDVVAYPITLEMEKLAPNATASPHHLDVLNSGPIAQGNCYLFKVVGCDADRSYAARTFYFAAKDPQTRAALIQAINFNTVLLCENQAGVSEFVNRLLPVLAAPGGQLPKNVDAILEQQVAIVRSNRSHFLPPPPQDLLAHPPPEQLRAHPQAVLQEPLKPE